MSNDDIRAKLDKTFDPAAIEAKWYAHWEDNGLFRPERPDAVPYTIVNPPPNVTGSLHVGHALDNTLQDIVIRYERLRGKDALWVVGTDHAGIATQMVVERQMEERQDKRTNYTREAFIEKVWEWKAESGGEITRQLRRLGCSMDWSREQFTMDPHFTKAVVKVFVDLYNQGLIYRDKRLVNWDPKLKTAISDLEVETREVQGHFWHFRYPLADGVKLDNGADHIVVATTRPETMLADMAVAVNGDDPRYRSVIGKFIDQPITGRRLRIVADEHADPELGSGAVKITPGHDFNDFEVGKRAGIKPADMLNMFDAEAKVVQTADGLIPDKYLGCDRFEAREMIVADMKEGARLVGYRVTREKIPGEYYIEELDAEPRTIQTPYGDRGGVVIEPWLTDQWYVDAATLAQPPMQAVRDGRIEIVPKTWEKTFFNWMENIQPWCVSRQLWWGHRIPAFYFPPLNEDGIPVYGDPDQSYHVVVAQTTGEAIEIAKRLLYPSLIQDLNSHYVQQGKESRVVFEQGATWDDVWTRMQSASIPFIGRSDPDYPVYFIQDSDVLDTWFSSALWPFATLGWPDQDAALLARHYPNDLLISGFDILFFWDARMAMMGMHFMPGGERRPEKDIVPWKRLYLHGLVRAADGQKMSKSKGNVVDPLGLIDKYGADALRFFMAAMESQGRDVKMDERRVEGYRNFATKLWNAARFCQSNGIAASQSIAAPAATSAVNKWIIGEVVETLDTLDKAMADLRFDAAANAIYHFVWDRFCDWYIELIKGSFDEETKLVAGWVLDQILVMLHPFMPFVTEELWGALGDRADYPLITASWPEPGVNGNPIIGFLDGEAVDAKVYMDWIIGTIVAVRAAKNEAGIPPGQRLAAHLEGVTSQLWKLLPDVKVIFDRVGRIDVNDADSAPSGAALRISVPGATLAIPLEGIIDITAEKARLAKALEASTKEAKSLEGRLNNPAFVEKAKPEAVDKARADHAHHAAEAERLAAALARLG